MKKILYYLSAAVLTLTLASCAKNAITPEDQTAPEAAGEMIIVANIGDNSSTKTTLSGNDTEGYKVLWSEGDQIKILKKGETQEVFTYSLIEGAGTKSGVFTGPSLPDGEYTAAYGDNLNVVNGGILSSKQLYSASEIASCAPMMANVSVVNGNAKLLNFKNICGLLRLNLIGNGKVKEIKVSTDQPQSGLISLDEDGAAYIRVYPAGKDVTLDCGESGVELSSAAKSFYISMPKNNYTGVKIEIKEINGSTLTRTLKSDISLNIARSKISSASLTVLLLPITGTIDGRTWVQLWPGGPKWATEDIEEFVIENVDDEIDNATIKWGENWRTPTIDEAWGLSNHNNCNRSHPFPPSRVTIITGQGLYSGNTITLDHGDYWLMGDFPIGLVNYMRLDRNYFYIFTLVENDLFPRRIRPVVKE